MRMRYTVDSRYLARLGAKIRERELSGSPVISHFRAKAQTRDFHGSESHTVTSAPLITKQYVER